MDSWEGKVRRFMLEEEEDDELFLLLVPTLQLCMYDEKKSEHTSSACNEQNEAQSAPNEGGSGRKHKRSHCT